MHQNAIITRQRHERFIKKISETDVVWSLRCEEGFATSSSNDVEDEEGEPIPVICFWSEAALAKACIKDGWEDYELVEIPLSDFIENWCIGLGNDGFLVGTNFDRNMFGFEAEPLDVIIELNNELTRQDKTVTLKKYDSLTQLVNDINEVKGDKPH